MICSWYSDSSRPFYFEMLCQDSKHHRFQIKLKPDLSTASLLDINTSKLYYHSHDLTYFRGYRVCEDTLVYFWRFFDYCGVYTGLMSARLSNVILLDGPAAKMLLPDVGPGREYDISPCPASGRFVRLDAGNSVTVLDFF